MVSSIVLSQTGASTHAENLHRIVESLHSVQVFDIAVVHDGNNREFAGAVEVLPVKPVTTLGQHEIARVADGITACDQKELHGVVVLSSDQKFISHALLVDLLHQFWISHKGIVRSRMQGNQNVYVIADALFGEIRGSSAGESLEAFAARHDGQVHDVPFDEQGIMIPKQPSLVAQPPMMKTND